MPAKWPVDVDRSRALATMIRARNKMCWRNALDGITMGRVLGFPGAENLQYVEGWVIIPSFPIVADHGWLVDPVARVIVDPTPSYHEDDLATYFPAVSYGRVGVARVVVDIGQQPFAKVDEPDAWAAAHWAAQVWCLGKENVLYLHDHWIREQDRRWIEEAEENPEGNPNVEVAR